MTQTNLSRRLTPLDSTFLYCEKPEQPMHIGGCMVYEGRISRATSWPGSSWRAPAPAPSLRQKVVFPPFALRYTRRSGRCGRDGPGSRCGRAG